MNNNYTIFYNRPYNPNKTYYQNQNRNVASRFCKDETALYAAIEEIKNNGYTITKVINGIGKCVTI